MSTQSFGTALPISGAVTDSNALNEVPLNDLPKWSPWPARLLSISAWSKATRDLEKVEQEYNRDKYGACIRFLKETSGQISIDKLKSFELGGDPESEIVCSIRNALFRMTIREARERYYRLVVDSIAELTKDCATVVELGAGYGYNLVLLKRRAPDKWYVGGEYAANAIVVAEQLSQRQEAEGGAGTAELQGIPLHRFNFYDANDYEFLEACPGPVAIFTVHAVQQVVPSAMPMIDALRRHKHKVRRVIHLETVNELHDATLIGLMRQKYLSENDYNIDMLNCFHAESDIRIVAAESNVFGVNPLNPTSILVWEWC